MGSGMKPSIARCISVVPRGPEQNRRVAEAGVTQGRDLSVGSAAWEKEDERKRARAERRKKRLH